MISFCSGSKSLCIFGAMFSGSRQVSGDAAAAEDTGRTFARLEKRVCDRKREKAGDSENKVGEELALHTDELVAIDEP